MKTSLLTTIAVITAFIASPAFSEILFDIDFSEPLHTNGQPITIDSSINTPSSQFFGSTEMIVGYAGLADNWAIFNQSDCSQYDQVWLTLPYGLNEVYFEADIYPQNLNLSDNNFAIFTDSSDYASRTISFHGLGNLNVNNSGSIVIGNFSDDKLYHLKLHASATYDIFTVEVNGAELYSSTLGSSDITAFRLSMGPWTAAATDCTSPVAAVSNIVVYEIPEDLLSAESQSGSSSITLLYLFVFLEIFRFVSKNRSYIV